MDSLVTKSSSAEDPMELLSDKLLSLSSDGLIRAESSGRDVAGMTTSDGSPLLRAGDGTTHRRMHCAEPRIVKFLVQLRSHIVCWLT